MAGLAYYCWSCYALAPSAWGRCERCGGHIEAPPGADYADLLVWALDHPLAKHGPAPVRRTATDVLSGHDEPEEVRG